MLVFVEGTFEEMVHKAFGNAKVDALVIASNSVIKANGKATLPPEVCGLIPFVWHNIKRADETKNEVRIETRTRLAQMMKASGHHKVFRLGLLSNTWVVTLPVKFDWRQKEDLSLIERSAEQLVAGCNKLGWKFVAMMRPIEDDVVWEKFKPKLEAIFSKTECRIGVYSGTTKVVESSPSPRQSPSEATKEYEGKFSDLPKEEQARLRKQWAAKAKTTKARKAKEAQEAALKKRQKDRVKKANAEIASVLDIL
jgi:hypothetical protein